MLQLRILDLKANAHALAEVGGFIRRYPSLIFEMTRREITDRYSGQILGALWAVGTPLLTMFVYVFAFTVLFRGRLDPSDTGIGYTAYALAGIVPWMTIQEAVTRGANSIVGSANLVKQIVFPSEVLPLKVVLGTFPTLGVGLVVALAIAIFAGSATLVGTLVLLPAAVLLLVVMCTGLSYAFASVGVFVRDVKDIIAFLFTIGFFLHPIIYAPRSVPSWLEPYFALSPFSHLIECFRDALLWGGPEHPKSWLISTLVALVFLVLGWRVFRMLRPSFGNAL